MHKSITFKQAAFVVFFLAVAQFAIQVSLLARGVEYAATSLVIDDTYYYLQTAWNAKQLGLVTFDGIHTTNGVQLLWFSIIYLLAVMAETKTALLMVTLAVSFLLNVLCYLPILKIGAVLKRPAVALLLAGLWSLQSLPFRIFSMGMENSLHALVFWCAIWQSIEFLIRVKNGARPNFMWLTIVLTLNVWTRLDSALLSAILFSFCIGTLVYTHRHNLKFFLREHIKVIAGSMVLAGVGLIVQVTAFQVMGDSILPVSALIKTSGEIRGLGIESINKFVEVLLLGMPLILQGRFPDLVLVLLGVSGILLVLRARATLPDSLEGLKPLLNLWSFLLVGELLYHIYIAVSGVQYMPYFAWYRSPSYIFWIITLSLVALFAFETIKQMRFSFGLYKWMPVGLSLITFFVSVYMFARSINFTSGLYDARYNTALWIKENSLPDSIFASWNAGQLGYFSNRTVINLDGVINNVDYYERVLRGSTSIVEYISENKVDYIADYDTYGSILDYPIVHTVPIDDGSGRSMKIWQVSSQKSSAP